MKESVDSLISRSDAEIVNKWIPSVGRMTQLMDSLSSSEDRIGGCLDKPARLTIVPICQIGYKKQIVRR